MVGRYVSVGSGEEWPASGTHAAMPPRAKRGSPERAVGLRGSLYERFNRKYIPEPNSGCWLWIGSMDTKGYGQIRDPGKAGVGRLRTATHVALEQDGRPVPVGMCACHHCDNPACVNPAHLFIGTRVQNTADMKTKDRGGNPPVCKGEENGTAKFTENIIRAIRKALSEGKSLRIIGREFGIAYTHVSRIKRRKVWSHVI